MATNVDAKCTDPGAFKSEEMAKLHAQLHAIMDVKDATQRGPVVDVVRAMEGLDQDLIHEVRDSPHTDADKVRRMVEVEQRLMQHGTDDACGCGKEACYNHDFKGEKWENELQHVFDHVERRHS
ncbi:unnamed protein product [Pedinophyceae sp. YPF-701]|nr:unnamed protein product [Pedinophyceae sp. YPF-701]